MKSIDDLLIGIDKIEQEFDKSKFKKLSQKEMIKYYDNEHIYINNSCKEVKEKIENIDNNLNLLLDKYDNLVLNGFDKNKEKKYEHEMQNLCIPCFIRLPQDQPKYIQLLYSINIPNEERSMNFKDIVKETNTLKDDKEIFSYELRRRFIQGLKYLNTVKEFITQTDLVRDSDDINDDFFDLLSSKKRFLKTYNEVNSSYQLMIETIKNI